MAEREADGSANDPEHEDQKYRSRLPKEMFSRNDFSVWSILKQCIGKELSKITMPVIFNEPLSFLQRIVEYLEYAPLLRQAAQADDPLQRHELVAAFAVSATASNWERLGKPFNPLLGETYELNRPDLGFKVHCEQVSHHPPVSAFHVDSDDYTIHGAIHPKLKFWGKSVEVTPKGTVTLHLKRPNEVYTWQNVNCCVHNVIIGKLWIEHYGVMEVYNHNTKNRANLTFKPSGWFGKDLHKVEGYLIDKNKRKLRAFYGKWVEGMYSYDVEVWKNFVKKREKESEPSPSYKSRSPSRSIDFPRLESLEQALPDLGIPDLGLPTLPKFGLNGGKSKSESDGTAAAESGISDSNVPDDVPKRGSTCDLNLPNQKDLWTATDKPEDSQKYYSFTLFATMLNELLDEDKSVLPNTDSRFRPDIRKLEEGDLDGAAEHKNRVEEKQRAARKDRKKQKTDWSPRFFHMATNTYTGKEDWITNNTYWNRDYTTTIDIF